VLWLQEAKQIRRNRCYAVGIWRWDRAAVNLFPGTSGALLYWKEGGGEGFGPKVVVEVNQASATIRSEGKVREAASEEFNDTIDIGQV